MFANVKKDMLSSIVVFLVALPLCMGVAIASGAPVAAGLITGIVGGLIVGWISGSPLQVSGPAAGLTVIVYDVVQQLGLEMLGLAVLLAGLLQIVAGSLQLGQWFRAVSPAVINGMLAGIGFLIFASQFHVMIDDKPRGSGAENLATIPVAVMKSLSLPELGSRELREFRAAVLREAGELHRLQIDIRERLAEHVPHAARGAVATAAQAHSSAHFEPDSAQARPAVEARPQPSAGNTATGQRLTSGALLTQLRSRQAALHERLLDIADQLRHFEESAAPRDRSPAILSAVDAAVERSQLSVERLREASVDDALRALAQSTDTLQALLASLKNHHLAGLLGVFTILVILLWQGLAPARLKVIPAPLMAVALATILAVVLVVPVLYVELPDNLWSDIRLPTASVLANAPWVEVIPAAILLAVVGSAETLLCATAVDQLHAGPRTRYDQELVAQGIGNSICGLLGALPMTGVIVRSSANIQAGAKSRLSAILHGVWLLLFVTGLAFLLRLIPTASLAAVLVYTGYKLINVKALVKLREFGWGEVGIYFATVGTIIFTDLLIGVLTGIGLSALKLLYTFSHLDVNLSTAAGQNRSVLRLRGAATFLRLPRLAAALDEVPGGAELHVDLTELDYIDHACLDLLMNWARQHQATEGTMYVDWESLRARFSSAGARAGA